MLSISQLTVSGRVERVSLEVRAGSLHALVGPNGAGKSTVLEAVLGLLPFEGAVTAGATGRVGLVPQRFGHGVVVPTTVRDFLAAPRTRWPVCFGVSAALTCRVEAMLAESGAEGLATRLLDELSVGQLKRVLVANALEPTPALLLLDEPEAGLDAEGRAWLAQRLAAVKQQGVTTLWVSHDAELVARLADTVTRLDGGRNA